ncbi:alpha/beta hydrolase [Sphingomonas lenta]|uniref:Alpha/beta hydrolase n=1 Tax=Sphingomonas lenta TaxID=1141887 RepID=A0A2A2SK88_9SPHN|nr:alpha/beta hydrolase [Sphingomonas lenta]PAX09652.1 alpha/beta hydrolase [Sphingomonas lenta]
MIDRRTLLGATAALPFASPARAQGASPAWPPAEHFKLWPGRPPGAGARLPAPRPGDPRSERELWLTGVAEPVVGVYRPARPDGRAVLSIPGGGYRFVSIENEGINVARALNPAGITVFALAYRLPGEGWADRADVPLQDAQRAMRLIRADARRYGVDPAGLGVLGFSAGGHLAASLTVGHDDRVYRPLDAADRQSARPAYSGLVYPVTSLTTLSAHRGSSDSLIGPTPDPAIAARYDTPRRVTAATPPLFMVHAMDDTVVPVEQVLDMVAAARAAKVPVETHLFDRGGHGFGALNAPERSPARLWTELFERWTRDAVSRTGG